MPEPADYDPRLLGILRGIMALEDERADINSDISDRYAEAKALGYDTRIMRQLKKRLRMRPEDRDEDDALLNAYEAAVGMAGSGEARASEPRRRPRNFTAPPNASSEEQLRAIICRILEMRGERSDMTKAIAIELRKARAAGFSPVKIAEACRWLEKCDAHGRERMLEAEELFQIYRDIGEGPKPEVTVEGDSKLVAMFAAPGGAAPTKAASAKVKGISDAIAMAQISRMNRGR